MSLAIIELGILTVLAPLLLWMTVRGEKHLTRGSAWSMAGTALILIVRYLLAIFAPPDPLTEDVLAIRALSLAGAGICCGSLAGWLYRTRDRAKQST